VPGKTLFSIEEAAEKGTVVMYLLSDAGQKAAWASVKPKLTKVGVVRLIRCSRQLLVVSLCPLTHAFNIHDWVT
jgi:hypothetical protein